MRRQRIRTLDLLHTLQRQIHPLHTNFPHLRELDERITTLVTRTNACVDQRPHS